MTDVGHVGLWNIFIYMNKSQIIPSGTTPTFNLGVVLDKKPSCLTVLGQEKVCPWHHQEELTISSHRD